MWQCVGRRGKMRVSAMKDIKSGKAITLTAKEPPLEKREPTMRERKAEEGKSEPITGNEP